MKRIVTVFAMLLGIQQLSAQIGATDRGFFIGSDDFYSYYKDKPGGENFTVDPYAGVEGSAYLSDEWTWARIKLEDNRMFDSILIKVNLFENQVYFKDPSNNRVRQVAMHVKEIQISDNSSKWNNTILVSGYGKDKKAFYQVVADGKKLGFIKELKVLKKEMKVFNAPPQKKFELEEGELFLYAKGVLYASGKDCSAISPAFGNDSKAIGYMSSNGLKCNKEKDLKKLVDYYNSY